MKFGGFMRLTTVFIITVAIIIISTIKSLSKSASSNNNLQMLSEHSSFFLNLARDFDDMAKASMNNSIEFQVVL